MSTPHEFREVIADYVGTSDELLRKGSTDDIARDATRSVYSCLDVDKVESTCEHPQPPLRDDVRVIRDVLR